MITISNIGTNWDAIIIGGGAAGLWAAGTAAERGRRVLVLEKNNKAGVKILMSGGTRCNITQSCDSRKIAEAFGKQGRVLLSPLSRMSPQDVVRIFESEGVATKVEDTGKIFPLSDRALDVRDALVNRLTRHGGVVATGQAVLDAKQSASNTGFDVTTADTTFHCQHLLITSGGLSFSGCGTTGDGYAWARNFGHVVTPTRPALTPLLSNAAWVQELSGLTLDNARVTAVPNRQQAKSIERDSSQGGLLWTHFGFSGPTAMNVSRCVSDLAEFANTDLLIDLLPERSSPQLEAWLAESASQGARTIGTRLAEIIPKRIAAAVLVQSGIASEIKLAELSKKHRHALLQNLKTLRVPIHGTRGYPKAEVTAGGVTLSEVNFQDMQSRLVPGLFFAGEILDLDGPIGGYNFQCAWSTGHTAGINL